MNSWKLAVPASKNRIQQTAEVKKLLLILQKLLSSWEDKGNTWVKRGSKPHLNYPAFALKTFSTALVLQDVSLAGTPENPFGTSGLQKALYFMLCLPSPFTFHKWKSSTWKNIFPSCLLFGNYLKEKSQVANEVTKAFFGVLVLWEVYKSDLFKRSIPLRNRKKLALKKFILLKKLFVTLSNLVKTFSKTV